MKKFKISNPAARWFAGLGFILAIIVFGICLLYVIGKLTLTILPIWWVEKELSFSAPYIFREFTAAGFFAIVYVMGVLTIIALICMIIYWLYLGVKKMGNYLFN